MLATLDDLSALGALRVNEARGEAVIVRATRLLELASAQVCAYLQQANEATLLAALSTPQQTALAAVVAEIAGRRLNVSAAPSSDFYPDGSSSIKLNRWDLRAIDDIVVGSLGSGTTSITITRSDDSSYLTGLPYQPLVDDFDVIPTT